jgi:hypothetical protein
VYGVWTLTRNWNGASEFDETLLLDLLTPWSNILLQRLVVTQPIKTSPVFCGTRRFTRAHHRTLLWAK